MRTSNLIVAGISVLAGMGAWLLSGPAPQPVDPAPGPVAASSAIQTTDVLVAAVDIPMGGTINEPEMKWVAFPTDASSQFITRTAGEDPSAEIKGAIARFPFVAGEPLRREKLIKGNGSGFLAAILPEGKRAVAIKTEGSGETSAGGFVLPNDFVDVISVVRDEETSKARGLDVYKSTTVLHAVRVLAIGQNIQERNGEKFITGQTATLELDPTQTEQVMLAQRVGTLSLSLRSIIDAGKKPESVSEDSRANKGLTVVRFGRAQDETVK